MSLSEDVDFLNNPDLREEEKKALRYYTERGFQYISEYFYKGITGLINKLRETKHSVEDIEKGIEKVKSTIKIIDQAFLHCCLTRDYITYRGIKNPELEKLRELNIGDVYKKPGFLSLTYCIDVALREDFAEIDEKGELNIMAIKIYKGSPAIFIGNNPELKECEILLPRKRELKLLQISSTMIKDLNVQIKHRTDISDSTRINLFITQDVSS
ncbi:MAG: ADP-ribosyltransferase [Deltaproteobacteria bacterium]